MSGGKESKRFFKKKSRNHYEKRKVEEYTNLYSKKGDPPL